MRLRPTLRTAAALAEAGLIAQSDVRAAEQVAARYAIAVTPAAARLIEQGHAAMARQYLPDPRELIIHPEERADPIGDFPHSPVPGLVHRYKDRVLLKIVHVCPVYCRFCFRREMVGPQGDGALTGEALELALDYIRNHNEIFEVILTGGDPLMLSARRIRDITSAIAAIPHVKLIRWHTRVPVADPDRVTPAMVKALACAAKSVFVAVHANHASEFTDDARAALARLSHAGISLLSQSVLLRGVNDNLDALRNLMRAFLAAQVKPYYLHHPDLAPGTAHFRLSLEEGLALVNQLRGDLSGLAQPAYVLDLPGGFGKIALTAANVTRRNDGRYALQDRHGVTHIYPPDATS